MHDLGPDAGAVFVVVHVRQRNERRPNSKYAALENCEAEVKSAEAMMRREGIAWLSSTHKSIEEIATTILRDIRPDRLVY